MFTREAIRWPAMLALTALLAGAAFSSLPVPASAAVPNREIRTESSVTDSRNKGVTVTCPEGTQRLAAGASVYGAGSEYVIIDELVPGPRNVTAYGYEYAAYGTTLTWSITVWAVCGSLSTTVYTYSDVSDDDIDDEKTAAVECPSNMVVLGTGYELDGARGGALVTSLTPTRDRVEVKAYEVDLGPGNPGDWSVKVYAICAVDPGGRSQASRTTSSNSDGAKSGDAPCSTGKETLGTGFDLNGFKGRLNIQHFYPTAQGVARTVANELVATTNDWSLTTFTICATA